MRQGYVRDQKDIKYLILFSMTFLPVAISQSDLLDIVLIDDAFGYFEFSEAFAGLLSQKYVAEVNTGAELLYVLTPKGKAVVDMMQGELRSSVKDKAEAAAIRVVRKIRRDSTIHAGHRENGDGTYNVSLEIRDKDGKLAGVDMMVFTKRQCAMLEENFKRNAERIYQDMITLLLADGPVS